MTATDPRWLKWNWGVPDWRDKDAYPKPDDLTLDEWWWEFERRRPEYREAWLLCAERTRRANVEEAQTLEADNSHRKRLLRTLDDPEFYAKRWSHDEHQALGGWDILRDPSDPSKRFDLAINRKTYGNHIFCVEDAWRHLPLRRPTPVRHIAITFDLAKPLKPQLEEVKDTFEIFRYFAGDDLRVDKERRKHMDLWPTYLRVIDAKDADAKFREIYEEVLQPDEEDQEAFDSQSEYAEQTAEQKLKQAREVMNNFPA